MTKIVYKYNEVYKSPSDSDIFISVGEYDVYLSSTTNRKRFETRFELVKSRMLKWETAYNLVDTDTTLLHILRTYNEVEKRGFKIVHKVGGKEVEYLCQKEMNITLNLQKRN